MREKLSYSLAMPASRHDSHNADHCWLRARLVSRNRTTFENNYPKLVDALRLLTIKEATIDGGVRALDDEGRSCFQLLRFYEQAKQPRRT